MAEKKTRKASLRNLPWKPLAAGLGAVAAGHAAGYMGSGLLSEGLTRTPYASRYWNQLSPEQRKKYARRAITSTGYLIPVALTAQQLATSAHMADEAHKKRMGQKEASVRQVYEWALEKSDE